MRTIRQRTRATFSASALWADRQKWDRLRTRAAVEGTVAIECPQCSHRWEVTATELQTRKTCGSCGAAFDPTIDHYVLDDAEKEEAPPEIVIGVAPGYSPLSGADLLEASRRHRDDAIAERRATAVMKSRKSISALAASFYGPAEGASNLIPTSARGGR